MDAKGMVIDRSRVLRLALLGLVAGGAAVVCGVLLGGSQASADDGSGPLDGVLGGTTQGIVDTTGSLEAAVTQTVRVAAAPVVAPAAPIVEPLAPIVQHVAAPVVQVVDAVPTLTSVVAPVAAQVDEVVASVPVVRDLVTAPVTQVAVPIVGAVDDALADTAEAVGELPIVEPIAPPVVVPPVAAAPVEDAPVGSSDASASDLIADVAVGTRAAIPTLRSSAAAGSAASSEPLAAASVMPSEAEAPSGTSHDRGATPVPVDERGAVAPIAPTASSSALLADATHDSLRPAGTLRGALADDEDLPASAVGDHDSSPD